MACTYSDPSAFSNPLESITEYMIEAEQSRTKQAQLNIKYSTTTTQPTLLFQGLKE